MGFFQDLFGDTQAGLARDSRSETYSSRKKAIDALNTNYGQARNDVNSGYGNARIALGQGYADATGAINPNYDLAIGAINTGSTNAQNYLDNTRNTAAVPLSDLGTKYGGATTLALNALGVNGQPGINTARSTFEASPGYDFNLTQGLEAINRARAASGQLAGGNTDRSVQTYGAGLASQEYNNWLNNLLGFTNPELSATTGASGINRDIGLASANLASNTGKSVATLQQLRGNMLADLASKYGGSVGTSYANEGTALGNIGTGLGNTVANVYSNYTQPLAGTFNAEAAARGGGAANIANLGLSLAKLGTGIGGQIAGGFPTGSSTGFDYADPTRLGTLY